MKDLAGICLYFYAINQLVKTSSILSVCLITFITVVFIIKYLRMKYLIENNSKINRQHLFKQKEFFIETMTHDFKVPTIAQLRGLELLQNEIVGELNENQKDMISQIKSSCNYVLNMIEMFSKTYMLENSTYKLNYEQFNISEIISACFEELSVRAKEKNITFSYHSAEEISIIEADKREIKCVVMNILNSSINYSKQGGRIDIKTESTDDTLSFSACGMELFENNNADKKYTTVGHTLGIYLCKKIVENHKGKLFLPDSSRGSCTFSFVIPKCRIKNA